MQPVKFRRHIIPELRPNNCHASQRFDKFSIDKKFKLPVRILNFQSIFLDFRLLSPSSFSN